MTQKYVCDAEIFQDGRSIKVYNDLSDVKINDGIIVFLSNGGKDGEMYMPRRGDLIKIKTRECPQYVEPYQ